MASGALASTGCDAVNGGALDQVVNPAQNINNNQNLNLEAGESITFTFTLGGGNEPASVTVGGTTQNFNLTLGFQQVTVPVTAGGVQNIGWTLNSNAGNTINVFVSCVSNTGAGAGENAGQGILENEINLLINLLLNAGDPLAALPPPPAAQPEEQGLQQRISEVFGLLQQVQDGIDTADRRVDKIENRLEDIDQRLAEVAEELAAAFFEQFGETGEAPPPPPPLLSNEAQQVLIDAVGDFGSAYDVAQIFTARAFVGEDMTTAAALEALERARENAETPGVAAAIQDAIDEARSELELLDSDGRLRLEAAELNLEATALNEDLNATKSELKSLEESRDGLRSEFQQLKQQIDAQEQGGALGQEAAAPRGNSGSFRYRVGLRQLRQLAMAHDNKRLIEQAAQSDLDVLPFLSAPPASGLRWDAWVEAQASGFDDNSSADTNGTSLGVTGGVSYAIDENVTTGAFLRYRNVSTDSDGFMTELDGDFFGVGVFIQALVWEQLRVEGLFAYDFGDNHIQANGATADFDLHGYSGGLRVSQRFDFGGVWLEPNVGASFSVADRERFTDSLGNTIPASTQTQGRLSFGPQVGFTPYQERNGSNAVNVRLRLGGIYDFLEEGDSTTTAGLVAEDPSLGVSGGASLDLLLDYGIQGSVSVDLSRVDQLQTVTGRFNLSVPFN